MKSLILLGMKHSGKSTLGRLYAQREKLPFADLDDLLSEEHAGPHLSPRDIMKTLGREVFQRYEAQAAVKAAARLQAQPGVLALGGGTVTNPPAMAALTDAPAVVLVYLKDSPEVLFERIMRGGLPAFLDPADPWKSFLQHYHDRTQLMEQACTLSLDLHGKTIPQALDLLVSTLKETPHAR